jgi:hypothetical protein
MMENSLELYNGETLGDFKIWNKRSGTFIGREEGCMLLETFFGSGMRLPTSFKQQFENYYTVCRNSGFVDCDENMIWEQDKLQMTDAYNNIQEMKCVFHKKQFLFSFNAGKSVNLDYVNYEFNPKQIDGYYQFGQMALMDILKARVIGNDCIRKLCY